MPPKTLPKIRTWGTRFDSLLSSPPNSVAKAATVSNDIAHIATKDMDTDGAYTRKESKMSHDASIFVGSLPANIEQPELARLLSEHLSQHAEVKNIKVVRDSKGGVCAFVQCEDASAAASLIHTIHSSPARPFLGRYLRYEPARAFRTLLISYRTPTQFVPFGYPEVDPTGNVTHKEVRTVNLALPTAMRLWKPHDTKYFSILYNVEAHDSNYHGKASGEPGLFLHPLIFDAETAQSLCRFFGPLEYFRAYRERNVSENGTQDSPFRELSTFPGPHQMPRSPGMDTGCWEVKWEHRDNCVNALMTLRRVPHLTVTWAHHPHSQGYERSYLGPRLLHPSATSFPFRFQSHPGGSSESPKHIEPVSFKGSPEFHHGSSPGLSAAHRQFSDPTSLPSTSPLEQPALSSDTSMRSGRAGQGVTSLIHQDPSPQQLFEGSAAEGLSNDANCLKLAPWTDRDFPSLSDTEGDNKLESGLWSEKVQTEAETAPMTCAVSPPGATIHSSEHSGTPSVLGTADEGQDMEIPPTPEFDRSPNTPRTSLSQFPKTPTTGGLASEYQEVSYSNFEPKDRAEYPSDANAKERHLDPTTIFVGGLDIYGPNAWNEEKVHSHFSKFGGVENVKVVRPPNSRSAFAFVKFNNTEGPARAVSDEHNRILDGRPIRVQFRDIHPQTRGAFKYGRGRAKFQRSGEVYDAVANVNFVPRESIPPVQGVVRQSNSSLLDPLSSPPADCQDDCNAVRDLEFITNSSPLQTGEPVKLESVREVLSGAPAAKESSSEYEHYREWYDHEAPSNPHTPPSSSLGSSASVAPPAVVYPLPPSGYYPPPWMPAYAQPFPYPLAFMPGYGYAFPPLQVPPTVASPPGSDQGTPASAAPSWPAVGHMYPPFIPYAAYPTAQLPAQIPPHLRGQAPLLPTGFMQGEQGTLIPLYPPEALDRYMAGTQANTINVAPQAQPAAQPGPWPSYTQPPAVNYPDPAAATGAPATLPPLHQFVPPQLQPMQGTNVGGWNQNTHATGAAPQQAPPSATLADTNARPPTGAFHGLPQYFGPPSAQQTRFERRSTPPASRPPPPRRQHRRDHDYVAHSNRGHNNRGGYQNRFPRGGTRAGGDSLAVTSATAAPQSVSLQSQPANGAIDWSQWASSR